MLTLLASTSKSATSRSQAGAALAAALAHQRPHISSRRGRVGRSGTRGGISPHIAAVSAGGGGMGDMPAAGSSDSPATTTEDGHTLSTSSWGHLLGSPGLCGPSVPYHMSPDVPDEDAENAAIDAQSEQAAAAGTTGPASATQPSSAVVRSPSGIISMQHTQHTQHPKSATAASGRQRWGWSLSTAATSSNRGRPPYEAREGRS